MIKRFKIGLIFIVFIYSCNNKQNVSENIQTIHLKKSNDVQPISRFISSVEYIKLKSQSNDLIIGQIEQLKILDNNFLIKHRFSSETSLLRFSVDGTYLNKIGQIGKGAGEILIPRDIIPYQNSYAVWHQTGINSYSKTGEFENKIFDINTQGNRFFYSEDNFFLFHETTAPGLLSEYSVDGELKRIYHPYKQAFSGFNYAGITEIGNDSFQLFSPMNDTIFAFSQNELSPKYVLKGKAHPTFIELLKKAGQRNPMETLRFINNNKHWVIDQFLENKNFIFIDYRLSSSSYSLIIRKSNWETMYIKRLINDIDGGVWDEPFYLSENDELYIPLNSYQITGHKIKNKKRHDFEKLQNETEISDNPVIMVCKLK